MDLRVPGRAWPQPPYGEREGVRSGGRARPAQAPFPPEAIVLDLEPIGEDFPGLPAAGGPPAAFLPHRGRLVDIRI